MGQVFSAADTKAGLAVLIANDTLVAELLRAIKEFGGQDSDSGTDIFTTPLTWKTELTSEQLASPQTQATKFSVESFDLDDQGAAVFKFDTGSISCSSFAWLNHTFNSAEAANVGGAIAELKVILAANADPLASILGPSYGAGADLVSAHKAEGAPGTKASNVAALYSFNREMLANSGIIKPDSVQYAEGEVKMLKDFSGIDSETNCLESIDWESSYVSHSGIRAPPWRASNGAKVRSDEIKAKQARKTIKF